MFSFTIFAVTFVAIIAAVVYFSRILTKKGTVPGMSPTDAREGNLPDIKAAGSLHEFLLYLHGKYGPIASFWYGPKFTVSIASPELFKAHVGPFDRPCELFAEFEPLLGKCSVQYTNKADGRARRNLYDPPFRHETLRYFYDTFNRLASELVTKLSLQHDEHIPLVEQCHTVVMKGLTQTSFGDYFKDEDKILRFRQDYDTCWHEMEASLYEDPIKWGTERQKKFEDALNSMKKVVDDIVKQRQENPTIGHQFFIDVLVENVLPEEQILNDCVTYMVGGFHTAGMLSWALYFLATHQECQDKLADEIVTVVGHKDVESDNLIELPYLRQVIDETLRVSVMAPFAARFEDNESELGGHVIPPGTPVIHALGVVLQDEQLWPDPKKFDPDRFSEANFTSRHRAAFKPFGFAGARVCPGQHFSNTEASVFLAFLIRAFKFNLVPGQVVEPKYGLITTSKDEIWATLEKRM